MKSVKLSIDSFIFNIQVKLTRQVSHKVDVHVLPNDEERWYAVTWLSSSTD